MLFGYRPSSHDVPVSIVQPVHVLHVHNACFRQTEARNILQICNIICVNGIHILTEGSFSSRDTFENAICCSEDAPVRTIYLYELFSY